MNLIRLGMAVCLLVSAAFGQKKDQMVEMQRDVALLQDSIRALQNSLNDKLAEIKAISQQSLDASTKANTGVAVLESGIRDRLSEQQKTVAGPVATLNSKLDQMSTEFQGLKETIADMNSRLSKLQNQMVDLGNQMKVMAAPPAAPPPTEGSPAGGSGALPPPGGSGALPPPGMTSTGLYENARRDQLSGRMDMAMQEYSDYLRYFGGTDLASNAQYQIGEILYNQQDYDSALKSFDMVMEKYPDSNKTLDARFMKGMTLEKMKQPTKAAQEYRALIKASPSSEQANKAKARLKALGLPYTAAAPAKAAQKKKR